MKTQATPPNWDCDVLVCGSGAAALATAVTAQHLGLKVIVLEKDSVFGGTTAWSGGWMWVPRNHLALRAGITEPFEHAQQYLVHELGEHYDETRVRAYLENAPRMVRFFEEYSALKLIDGNGIPDFHGHNPFASLGGRSVGAAPFDGKALGKHIKGLKKPLWETTFLGMGIASGVDLRHFMNATRSWSSFVYVFKRVARYALDVLLHGRGMHLVNGNAMVGALAKTFLDLGGEIRLGTPVVGLVTHVHMGAQRVIGVELDPSVRQGEGEGEGESVDIKNPAPHQQLLARHGVVLATGGFPHDAQRKKALLAHDPTGHRHFSAASRGNTGDGLRLGESIAAVVDSGAHQAAALAPVSLVPKGKGRFVHFPHLLERAKPGLIAVTRFGQRFVNEADSYHDFMIGLIKALPQGEEVQAWLIADHRFVRRYGLGAVKPAPVPMKSMIDKGYLIKAQSIKDLAQQCGIDEDALQVTVQNYNKMALVGEDLEFGKGQTPYNQVQGDSTWAPNPCMAPLRDGPFYAVRVQAGSLGTFAGLKCNEHAQVLSANGQPISGLYAVGNDQSSVMGGHYPSGGITLGPAMTFGFLAAQHLSALNSPKSTAEHPFFKRMKPMYYELATMTLPFGTAAQAAQNVQAFAANGQGEFLACWFTDIGVLNQMIVLRGFESLEDLRLERERTQLHANPFGCAEFYLHLEQHSYQGFPWMKPVKPSAQSGIEGPFYEIRTYGIKPGGVQGTIDLWEQAVPLRDKLSPCVVAMVALDGPLRFTNIWAYPSLDARTKARAESVAQGIWPPKGGPALLTTQMTSTIALATAVSPLK